MAWTLAWWLAGAACTLGPNLPAAAPFDADPGEPAFAAASPASPPTPSTPQSAHVTADPCAADPTCATPQALDQAVREVLQPAADELLAGLNDERAALGLPALEAHQALHRIAFRRASDMQARGYLAHHDPVDGSLPAQAWMAEAGFGGLLAEALFAGPGGLGDLPASALAGWLGSDTNRVVLLAPGFRFAGVGLRGGADGWTVTLVLAENGP